MVWEVIIKMINKVSCKRICENISESCRWDQISPSAFRIHGELFIHFAGNFSLLDRHFIWTVIIKCVNEWRRGILSLLYGGFPRSNRCFHRRTNRQWSIVPVIRVYNQWTVQTILPSLFVPSKGSEWVVTQQSEKWFCSYDNVYTLTV